MACKGVVPPKPPSNFWPLAATLFTLPPGGIFGYKGSMAAIGVVSNPSAATRENTTFSMTTNWFIDSSGIRSGPAAAGVKWMVNRGKLCSSSFYFGLVASVNARKFPSTVLRASNWTLQISPQGGMCLMLAEPYLASVPFLDFVNLPVDDLDSGYPDCHGAQLTQGIKTNYASGPGAFSFARDPSTGNTFLLYTDQQNPMGQLPGGAVGVPVVSGEQIASSARPWTKEIGGSLYPQNGLVTVTADDAGNKLAAVPGNLASANVIMVKTGSFSVVEFNCTTYPMGYTNTFGSETHAQSIAAGASATAYQALLPSTTVTFTVSGGNIISMLPVRYYLQAGTWQVPTSTAETLLVVVRNTVTRGSNVYYAFDKTAIPAMKATEKVFDAYTVINLPKSKKMPIWGIVVLALGLAIILAVCIGLPLLYKQHKRKIAVLLAARTAAQTVPPKPLAPMVVAPLVVAPRPGTAAPQVVVPRPSVAAPMVVAPRPSAAAPQVVAPRPSTAAPQVVAPVRPVITPAQEAVVPVQPPALPTGGRNRFAFR